jgi:hypothetical protein
MPQRKFFVATGIVVFDFELFIGGRCDFLGDTGTFFIKFGKQGMYEC